MKVKFSADEWYPVYTVAGDEGSWGNAIGDFVELTEDELRDFRETLAKFEAWQDRIRNSVRGY